METVNERIKLLRIDNKLTQKQFADRILVTQSYLSRIENGKETPNDKLTKLIALEFNVSTGWLEKGIGSKSIEENSYDYFEREYNKEHQEGLMNITKKFIEYLQNINNSFISIEVGGIMIEMENFLKGTDLETNKSRIILFQKIASIIMELFIQLNKIQPNMNKKDFNSLMWICTSIFHETLFEIEKLYFNPEN